MRERKLEFSNSQKNSLISGFVTIGVGAAYLIMSLALPRAAVGVPHAPKVFPLGLSVIMVGLGIALVIQQYLIAFGNSKTVISNSNTKAQSNMTFKERLKLEDHTKKIILTVVNGVLYTLLFKSLGYVFSTIVFLGFELLLFNGRKRWRMILTVSILFSLIVYVLFSTLLGVYLPRMPIIGF